MDEREVNARKRFEEMSISSLEILLQEDDYKRLGVGMRPYAEKVLDEMKLERDKSSALLDESRHLESIRETRKSNRIALLALVVSVMSIFIAIYAMNNPA